MTIRVLFVCHGNICRSTMAQFVFQHLINQLGCQEDFIIDSRATSSEEIGNGPHRGTLTRLRQAGIPALPHRASRITRDDYKNADMIIGMDEVNIRNLMRMLDGDPEGKVHTLMSYTGHDRDVADPWYTDDFETAYNDIFCGCTALLKELER
jgi:protein-tyrosine phosphatase